MHERELPGEIKSVLDARVHALAAGRAVDVRRVAGDERAPLPIVWCVAEGDAEGGEPVRIADRCAARTALVQPALEIRQRRVCGRALGGELVGLHGQSLAVLAEREGRQQAVGMQEDVQLVVRQRPLDADVADGEGGLHSRAREVPAQAVARGAVGTVAADQPRRTHGLFAVIGVAQGGRHALAILREAHQLDAPLRLRAEGRQILA